MAGRGSVKLSIYSTFKDDGTKKAERALTNFAKKFGEVDKATGKVKLDGMAAKLAAQSVKWDQLSAKCHRFGNAVGKAAQKFAPFSAAAAGALGASIKLASDFENSMAKVATIMDKSVMSTEEMGAKLLDLSNDTGKSVAELAEAAYQAQSASVDTAHAVEFVGTAVGLSKAGFTETATAVDTLTTIINAYGLEADRASSLADKLVQTQNKGKTTVDELSASIGQAIPTAAAYGVNIDNLLSSYVILTKQGINTANSTTYLNGMMNELAKEGTKVSDSLQELTGKGFSELMADGKSVGDVLQILYDSVEGDSTAFANLWSNTRAGKGALAIVGAGVDEFNAELAGMGDSAGVVESALEDLDTPAVKAQKALNSLKNTGILLGQEVIAQVAPALEKLVESARKLFERFRDMPKGQKQAIVKMLEMTAAIAPLLKLVSSGAHMVGNFAGSMGKLTANLAKMAARGGAAGKVAGKLGTLMKGPVVLGIMAAAAAIAFIVKLFVDWKRKQENVRKATEGLERACSALSPTLAGQAKNMLEMSGSTAQAAMSVDELVEKQAELADTIAERNAGAQADITMLETAKDTIDQYANATGLSAEEQGRLKAAIQIVNDECGTQYEVTDAVNGVIADEEGNILKTTDAIDEYIDKKKEQIRLEAIAENLKDLYKQQYEAQLAVKEATDEYNAALSEQAENTNANGVEQKRLADNVEAAEKNMNTAEAALDSVNKSVKAGEKELGKAGKEVDKTAGKLDKAASGAKTKGSKFAVNFASGIMGNMGKASGAASSMASSAKNNLGADTYSMGLNFADGFKRGIAQGAAKVATTAASMAQQAVAAAKKAAGISSPSKVMMEQGRWFGEGYAIGIENETRNVSRTAARMADAALSQFDERPGYSGGRGGTVYNISIDGATVNDAPAMRQAFLGLMTELRRLSYV